MSVDDLPQPGAQAQRPSSQGSPRGPLLSHVDHTGQASMVDVGDKPATGRLARAEGAIRMSEHAFGLLRENRIGKGDVLTVAKVAGIMAAKRTADLIPLCHPIALSHADVTLTLDPALPGVRVEASARTTGPTGVEMEALTAATVALLTVYDMVKAVDRGMVMEGVRVIEKAGGASGTWRA